MANTPKTVSRWKYLSLWLGTIYLVWSLGYSLIAGEIAPSRFHPTLYTRSQDPAAYCTGIAIYALLLGLWIFGLLKFKPHPRQPSRPSDLTPHDWLGHPLDRK